VARSGGHWGSLDKVAELMPEAANACITQSGSRESTASQQRELACDARVGIKSGSRAIDSLNCNRLLCIIIEVVKRHCHGRGR
jgi:hypothetical protein